MSACKPGIYRVTRYNWSREVSEVIGHFAIVDGKVVFFNSVDQHNCDFIRAGPINGYTALRIENMLKQPMGTACLFLEWMPSFKLRA
ncbi:MAG: hypothetical protein ACT4TC_16625 [Myxococcaceae bacterium]